MTDNPPAPARWMLAEHVPPRCPDRGSSRVRATTGKKQPSVQHVLERPFSQTTAKLDATDLLTVNRARAVLAGICA